MSWKINLTELLLTRSTKYIFNEVSLDNRSFVHDKKITFSEVYTFIQTKVSFSFSRALLYFSIRIPNTVPTHDHVVWGNVSVELYDIYCNNTPLKDNNETLENH
jgi:hypothetical protein